MAWIIQGDQLVNTDSIAAPGTPFVGDSPYTFWRIDPNANGGMPYIGLMIGVPVLAPEPPAVPCMFFGSEAPDGLFFGDSEVTEAYWGSIKVY